MAEINSLIGRDCGWSNIVQKEIRRNTRTGVSTRTNDGENFSLVGKGKRAKGKKAQGKIDSSQNGGKEKKDISKKNHFHCHEFRHYATKCANKKSNKNDATKTTREALSS